MTSILGRLSRRHTTAVAYLALFVALGGGSYALAALSAPEKRVVIKIARKQANKRITARAAGLSVKHAASAASAASANSLACTAPVAGTGQMVKAGAVCIDKYEASVWTQPTGGTQLTTEAQIDAACPDNGQPSGGASCTNLYARSVPGVVPARSITYFQAQQALANSGRRLASNAEWQQAVSGTPDSTACNVSTGAVQNTGANAGCVSRFGAFDMVGNVKERVGDWDEEAWDCADWPEDFGFDEACVGRGSDGSSLRFPAALFRGGGFDMGAAAGPFAVDAQGRPSTSDPSLGFRGAR